VKLHEAVRAGDVEAVKRLLATSDVNAVDREGRTPLHYAYRGEIGRMLIEHGADPRAVDRYGVPAWAYILAHGDAEAVRLISAFVDDILAEGNLRPSGRGGGQPGYRDYSGRSSIHYAASK